MTLSRNKVVVGMSGGVDSSVAAYLLKKAGYDVVGVFIMPWQPDHVPCTAEEDRRDAMRVAARLSIPLFTVDAREEYKESVAMKMIREYKKGNTPNPDIWCNKEIKFSTLERFADSVGAYYLATGHYADTCTSKKHGALLVRPHDKEKDQTYFLWAVPQSSLKRTLFPLAHLTKKKVRDYASELHLPNSHKKDSQGVCFLGNVDMKEFLKEYLSVEPGHVVDESGAIIGMHEGALLYTLGERLGTHSQDIMVVEKKDVAANTLVVKKRDSVRGMCRCTVNEILHHVPPAKSSHYDVQIRHRGALYRTQLHFDGDYAVCELPHDIYPAPGQSLVWFDGDILCGGGVIRRVDEIR